MKKLPLVNTLLIVIPAILGVIVFFMSFGVAGEVIYSESGHSLKMVFGNTIWGPNELRAYVDNQFQASTNIPAQYSKASFLPIFGYILTILGSLLSFIALAIKDRKARIGFLVFIGAIILLGGIFQFFAGESIYATSAKMAGMSIEEVKRGSMQSGEVVTPGFLGIFGAILTMLSAATIAMSQFVTAKKR